jgi:hypothetical protein
MARSWISVDPGTPSKRVRFCGRISEISQPPVLLSMCAASQPGSLPGCHRRDYRRPAVLRVPASLGRRGMRNQLSATLDSRGVSMSIDISIDIGPPVSCAASSVEGHDCICGVRHFCRRSQTPLNERRAAISRTKAPLCPVGGVRPRTAQSGQHIEMRQRKGRADEHHSR